MRILCLGNNTDDTDAKTKQLAQDAAMPCHGLISDLDAKVNFLDLQSAGYYHSSVYDLEHSRMLELALLFDKLVVLDQTKEQYSHPNAFYNTLRAAKAIEKIIPVEYLNLSLHQGVKFFEDLTQQNKSFCIFPFIELLVANGNTTVCCRSETAITKFSQLENFKTDKNYVQIRNNMINGVPMPEHCSVCYELESKGIRSARIQETIEWSNRLDLYNLDDLANIEDPAYYEVRASNICNLQCRTCAPRCSHLIAEEFNRLGIRKLEPRHSGYGPYPGYSNFDFVNLKAVKKLYVAGGEPTAMPEFYNFLDTCIDNKNTDFEIVVNTNATKINTRFKKQLQHFDNFQFTVSIDGFKTLNHYVRWPSDWNTIIENCEYLVQNKYFVSFNITVSIYNVWALDKLLLFLENKFPSCLLHCQLAMPQDDIYSALNFPNKNTVLTSLRTITKMKCYKNDPLLHSFINGLMIHYDKNYNLDLAKLKKFFEFNDRLDQSRNIRLVDYIPELHAARTLL